MTLILLALFLTFLVVCVGILLRAFLLLRPTRYREEPPPKPFNNMHLYLPNPDLCDFTSGIRREMEREFGINATSSRAGSVSRKRKREV